MLLYNESTKDKHKNAKLISFAYFQIYLEKEWVVFNISPKCIYNLKTQLHPKTLPLRSTKKKEAYPGLNSTLSLQSLLTLGLPLTNIFIIDEPDDYFLN